MPFTYEHGDNPCWRSNGRSFFVMILFFMDPLGLRLYSIDLVDNIKYTRQVQTLTGESNDVVQLSQGKYHAQSTSSKTTYPHTT